jgi:hypothetical protein
MFSLLTGGTKNSKEYLSGIPITSLEPRWGILKINEVLVQSKLSISS